MTKKRTRLDKNEIVSLDTHAEIILYDNFNNEKSRALIDIEDIDKVKNYKWCEMGSGYAAGSCYIGEKKTSILLHRLVMNCLENKSIECDHINRNRLDCRKPNLRFVTDETNTYNRSIPFTNTSGFAGVSFFKFSQKWRSYINVNRRQLSLGYYSSLKEAAYARIEAEIKYYGEYRSPENEIKYNEMFDKFKLTFH